MRSREELLVLLASSSHGRHFKTEMVKRKMGTGLCQSRGGRSCVIAVSAQQSSSRSLLYNSKCIL